MIIPINTASSNISPERIQADLKWLLQSANLLHEHSLNTEKVWAEIIKQIPQITELECKSYRLGHYFEALWENALSLSNELEPLLVNQQIIINKQTLGEFDSIFHSRQSQQVTHCELAVKFYLQVGEGAKLSDWLGPNLRDRFDYKYQRLFEHQLQLSTQPQVAAWLAQRDIKVDKQAIISRGRLFYPLQAFLDKKFVYPAEVASAHLKGFWCLYSELPEQPLVSEYQWYQLPKSFWLSQVMASELKLLKPVDLQEDEQLLKTEMQQLVAWNPHQKREAFRGFIVPEDWLALAKTKLETN